MCGSLGRNFNFSTRSLVWSKKLVFLLYSDFILICLWDITIFSISELLCKATCVYYVDVPHPSQLGRIICPLSVWHFIVFHKD